MKRPKVSVIVPVYNVKDNIAACIESLRNQTLRDIELIFVDDVGDDGSIEVVESCAAIDKRIHIIRNTANQGSGISRNRGIENSSGEYLSFVDADDYISNDFLELLYNKAIRTNADIVKGSRANASDETAAAETDIHLNEYIERGMSEGRPLYGLFTYEHWSAIYRRELIMRSGARYGTSRNGQDTTFLLKICYAAKSFELEQRAVYVYVARRDSAVHTFTSKRLRNEVAALHEKIDFVVERLPHDEVAYEVIANQVRWNLRIHSFVRSTSDDRAVSDAYIHEIKNETKRLPDTALFTNQGLDIDALVNYGINIINAAPFTDDAADAAAVEADTLFDMAHSMLKFDIASDRYQTDFKSKAFSFLEKHTEALCTDEIIKRFQQVISIIKGSEQSVITPNAPLVSIIVPVYNVMPYIGRCLSSLRIQTLENIEICVIDDHGTDGSIDVAKKHAAYDPRIRIIRNPHNLGEGGSRNSGIDAALGKYLAFVDADDFIAPDFLKTLLDAAESEHADISKGSRSLYYDGVEPITVAPSQMKNEQITEGVKRNIPLFRLFTYEHTTALYLRKMVVDSGARYGASKNSPDTTFLLQVSCAAKAITFAKKALYYYVQRPGSAVHSFSDKRLADELNSTGEKIAFALRVLPESNHKRSYIEEQLRSALKLHAYAVTIPEQKQFAEDYLEELRSIASRLPFAKALRKGSLDMRALVCYGINLVNEVKVPGVSDIPAATVAAVVSRWVDFLIEYPMCEPVFEVGFIRTLRQIMASRLPVIEDVTELSLDILCNGDDDSDFIEQVRCELKRMPNLEALLHYRPDLRALVEYGVNLQPIKTDAAIRPRSIRDMSTVHRWVDFISQSGTTDKTYFDGLRDALRRALRCQIELSHRQDSTQEAKEYLLQLSGMARQLPNPDILARNTIDMRALIEHGANLCPPLASKNHNLQVKNYADAVSRWVSFIGDNQTLYEEYGAGLKHRIDMLNGLLV